MKAGDPAQEVIHDTFHRFVIYDLTTVCKGNKSSAIIEVDLAPLF